MYRKDPAPPRARSYKEAGSMETKSSEQRGKHDIELIGPVEALRDIKFTLKLNRNIGGLINSIIDIRRHQVAGGQLDVLGPVQYGNVLTFVEFAGIEADAQWTAFGDGLGGVGCNTLR